MKADHHPKPDHHEGREGPRRRAETLITTKDTKGLEGTPKLQMALVVRGFSKGETRRPPEGHIYTVVTVGMLDLGQRRP